MSQEQDSGAVPDASTINTWDRKMHDVVTYLLLRFVQYGLIVLLMGALFEVFMMGAN